MLKNFRWLIIGATLLAYGLNMAGCSNGQQAQQATGGEAENVHEDSQLEMLVLPRLDATDLGGERLKVVATTSIIGDVVGQVGGEAIELTTLMAAGQDPHSYEPGARVLTSVAGADVIFVNGWDLEEGLVGDLESIAADAPIVAVSANITPLAFGDGDDDHDHEADPHVWFSVHNVEQWVENVQHVLSDLDPDNAEVYADNATAYIVELESLQAYTESALGDIPQDKRFLVSNHNSFGYFAEEYGFDVLGTVIPAASTLAEPSASDLAGLTEMMEAHGVCTIFTETAMSDVLAQTVAGELKNCDEVKVVALYTGATGPSGSGADSYSGMFRANVDAIVSGLKQD